MFRCVSGNKAMFVVPHAGGVRPFVRQPTSVSSEIGAIIANAI